jgi:hypothetical protein
MPTADFNMDEIDAARRKAIAETIHPISLEELKALGEGLFPYPDHPWHIAFFDFIKENADSTFHHATTDDRIHILYCRAKEKGMWFMPGSGRGPLRAKGLEALKQIVDSGR